MYAAGAGYLETVQLLLEKGANVNAKTRGGWTALTWAAWGGSSDVVKLLEGRVAAKTLMDAACLGDLKLLQQLIKEGANVKMETLVEERTPLMGAVRRGHLEVVKALIALGANVNAKTDDGRTALTEAVENGNVEVVRLLLDKGADVTARANGRTALEIARTKGSKDIEEILRAHGAKD
jgi:ankyrin repeat protein